MTDKIVIPGSLPDMNAVIAANRSHYHAGAKLKKQATTTCRTYALAAKNKGFALGELPANLKITWYVKNRRKDKDNITSAIKFVLDGMVDAGLIENDGWQQIGDIYHVCKVDKNERVEIEVF